MWVRKRVSAPWLAVILVVVGNGADADDLTRFSGESQHAPHALSTARDLELMTAVWNSMRADRIVDPTTIEVVAEEGRLTLTGMQPMLVARDRARHIAETIAGVHQIDDHIIVQRGPREADTLKLESDVLYMLLTDPATARSSISVTADADGHVTLAGTVRGYGERYLAEQLARTVAGVRKVTNRIELPTSATIPARSLAASVRQLLHWDAYIDDRDIHVSAKRGVVTLKGSLRTLAEKRRAVDLSWAAGARLVVADALRVSGAAARVHERRSAPRGSETDQGIVAAAGRALQSDPRLADCSIDLHADNGIVRLEGSVPTLAAKRAAIWLVSGIREVQSVHNELRISADASVFSDEEILLRIERGLMLNSLTREDAIAVSVRDGTVVLEGEAGSWLSRLFAENAAASVMGVETITNEIVIADSNDTGATGKLAASTGVWWIPGANASMSAMATTVAGTRHP